MRNLLVILMICALTSCRSSTQSVSRDNKCAHYIRWFEEPEHGMMQTKTINQMDLSCFLTNSTYEAIAAAKTDCRNRLKTIHALDKSRIQVLNFTIKITDLSGKLKAASVMFSEYLKDQSKNNFILLCNNDTLKPVFYHMENNINIAPNINFIVSFEVPGKLTDDLVLFHKDPILDIQHSFSFTRQHINQIPKI